LPAFQGFFGTTALTWGELGISIGCAIAIIPLTEIQKGIEYFVRKRKNKQIENFKAEEDNKAESLN
jgi:hypothetical protein